MSYVVWNQLAIPICFSLRGQGSPPPYLHPARPAHCMPKHPRPLPAPLPSVSKAFKPINQPIETLVTDKRWR